MLACLLDDLAYLLGLTCGRGHLDYNNKSLSIEIPFKSIQAVGVSKTYNQREQMIIGTDGLINRLGEFTGKFVRKECTDSCVRVVINFEHNSHTWQSITSFFQGKSNFYEFTLPNDFSFAPENLKLNLLRGFSDVAGFIRKSNVDQVGRHRVYLEVPNSNWTLPIQICQILQDEDISIPVQSIQWGHPNTRGERLWSKEHQIRIYAEYFRKVGFSIGYKNEILLELAEENMKKNFKSAKFCNPTTKRISKPKSYTTEVNSTQIEESIRGKHFDSFWQICIALGCQKCISS